jgi:uncharacterized membrane protein YdjX (TVP38/TMEM64 family)
MKAAKIIAIIVLVGLLGWLGYANREHLDKDSIIAYGKGLPAVWLIVLFALLPLIGVPISLFLILAGLRFGLAWGMLVSAGCIYFHHIVAYWIAQGALREKLVQFIRRRGHELPSVKGGNGVWYTLIFASVHGPPYTFKIFLLALTDIPFLIYGGIGGTTYILFGLIPVGTAAAATKVDVTYLYVGIIIVSAAALAFNHFRRQRKKLG